MKCPRCGHWNKPSFPRCFQCGEPLNPRQAKKPDWRDTFERPQTEKKRVVYDDTELPVEDLMSEEDERQRKSDETLASEMTRLKDRRARGSVYLQELRQSATEQGMAPTPRGVTVTTRRGGFFSDLPDDPEQTLQLPPEPAAGRRSRTTAAANDFYSDATANTLYNASALASQTTRNYAVQPQDAYTTYDSDLPPAFDTPGPIIPPDKRHRSTRIRGPMLVAYVIVGIVLLALAIFLGYAVTSAIVPTLTTSLGATEKLDNVDIETFTTEDGLAAHRLRIPGEEGTQVYIAELLKSFVVVGGYATVEAPDYVFYETIDPLDFATMDVSLTPTLVRNGVETRMESIRYTINIPESQITLISPETERVTVSASIYSMRFTVLPNSRVIINGQDVSDTVNEEGLVVYNPSVQAIGDNLMAITVRAPYHREKMLNVIIYRAPMEIPLELNAATLMNTSDEDLTINATTQLGANITIETPTFEIHTEDLESTGKFSFVAQMTRVGNNTIRIRASYPGKADSVLEHVVYYLPPPEVYTRKAWALNSSDYSELLNNIALRIQNAQIYLCSGTIKEILSNKPQLVIMDVGTDGKEALVMIENLAVDEMRKSVTWTEGESYRVYADVSGVYNNMPRFIGRYSYPPLESKE